MAYELKQAAELSQRIDLTGRERLTVTGVEDVERFDELSVVMRTAAGVLVVTGRTCTLESSPWTAVSCWWRDTSTG